MNQCVETPAVYHNPSWTLQLAKSAAKGLAVTGANGLSPSLLREQRQAFERDSRLRLEC